MSLQMENILIVVGVLLVAAIIITVVAKIFESIFFGVIVAVIVCVLFTVFFGDGRDIVHYVSSFMNDDVGTKIEESYDYYKNKEQEKQLLDSDKVTEYVTNAFSDLKPFTDSIFSSIPDPPD